MSGCEKRSCYKRTWLIPVILLLVVAACSGQTPATQEKPSITVQNTDQSKTTENVSSSENTTVKSRIPGFDVGIAAPDFTLSDMNYNKVTLSKLKGKNILMNFWATWCDPCKRELPHLDTYYKNNKRENLLILTVCSDSSRLGINTLLSQTFYTFPILVDSDSHVRRLYSNQKDVLLIIPTTFMIDSKGIIVKILRHQFGNVDDIEDSVKAAGFQ